MESMEFLSIAHIALIPVVTALIEGFKQMGYPSRFAFVLSLLLGVGAAWIFPTDGIGTTILAGIVVGLSASGFYAGAVKPAVSAIKSD